MNKRALVVLICLAAAAGLAVAAYFGYKAWFTKPPSAEQARGGDRPKDDGGPPADPSAYRPAPVNLAAASEFLYHGGGARQHEFHADEVGPRRAAVLRGRALAATAGALAGVRVAVLNHTEFGSTQTDEHGDFDLAVGGGGVLVVSYTKDGFLPAFRPAYVPWQDYVVLPDAALTETPDVAGALDLPLGEPGRELRARAVKDADGARQAVLLATQGAAAEKFVLRHGVKDRDDRPPRLTIRMAEYAVGRDGPSALAAPPPPGTEPVYAVEVGADEAASAREIAFTKPYPLLYVENFLHLPAGSALPLGWYDRAAAAWVRAEGRVVYVIDVADGMAVLDVDGSQQPADADALARLGITDAERRKLGELYKGGQTLWRMPVSHVGTWAVLSPARPPEGAVAPPWDGLVKTPGELPDGGPEADEANRAAAASVAVAGTPLHLTYHGDRAPGRKAAYTLDVALTDDKPPAALKGVQAEVMVAGRRFRLTANGALEEGMGESDIFAAGPGERRTFTWDGKDAYGRLVEGRRPAVVRVGYVYDRAEAPAGGEPARRRATLWRERRVDLGDWDGGASLGGWTLDVQHAYDPVGRVLHPGGGGRRSGKGRLVITTVAGGDAVGVGLDEKIGDGDKATAARFTVVRGLALDPDGALYIADAGQKHIRRVAPDGIITTAASTADRKDRDNPQVQEDWTFAALSVAPARDGGLIVGDALHNRVYQLRPGSDRELVLLAGRGGKLEYQGEGGPAAAASLSGLGGVAVGPDGSVYVAENAFYQCVVRLGADGLMTRVAGGAGRPPDLGTACGVAMGPDGALYACDGEDHRVWRVGPEGATVVAGTGQAGFSGDGGPADKAELNGPNGVAVAPDGALYIADANNRRVRRVGPDDVISTVAGTGQAPSGGGPTVRGDGDLAEKAALDLAEPRGVKGAAYLTGLAVGPEGDLYVAEAHAARVRRVGTDYPGLSAKEIVITPEKGGETYVFDGAGRHLRTLDAPGGKEVYTFDYDKEGRLAAVRDRDGHVTKVERDPAGRPKALVGPNGERTELRVDDDGYLSGVGDEASGARMTYADGGLLATFKGPGGEKKYTYDDLGRLKK